MTDLVERLRDSAKHWVHEVDTRIEAANEIERLQKQIFALRASEIANQTLYRETKRMAEIEANNERLEARVAELEGAVAAEREQCAKVCNDYSTDTEGPAGTTYGCACREAGSRDCYVDRYGDGFVDDDFDDSHCECLCHKWRAEDGRS